jgi:hypothetical protein
MNFLVSFFGWFGTAFSWFLKEFLPKIAKRLGLGAILGIIQKTVSLAVIALVVAFFGIVINFALSIFSAFSNFLNYLNNIHNGGTWASCFIHMMNVSGISAGIQMAMPFYLSVLVFFFIYAAYKIAFVVMKTISDETSKTIESVK